MRNEELISAWIRFTRVGQDSAEKESLLWAFLEFDRICSEEPERALDLILEILGACKEEFVMAVLAAGPLEDLLARRGSHVIERVEQLARRLPRFRWLLGGVWKNEIEATVWKRVQDIRGEPW